MAKSRSARSIAIACVGMLALSTIPASAANGGSYDASSPSIAAADAAPCRQSTGGPPVGLLDRRPSCFTMELFVADFREFYVRLDEVIAPYQEHWLVSGGKVDGILDDIDAALSSLDVEAGGALDTVSSSISSATDATNAGLGSLSETFVPTASGGSDPLAAFEAAGGFSEIPQQLDVALGLFGDIGVALVPGQCPNTTSPVAVLLLEQIVARMGEVIELLPQDLVIVALAGSTLSAHPVKIVMQAAKIVLTEIMYLGQAIDENAGGCAEAKDRALTEIIDEKTNELIVQSARTLTAIDVASAGDDEMIGAITEARAEILAVDHDVRDVGRDVRRIEEDIATLLENGELTLERIALLLVGQDELQQTADTILDTSRGLVTQLADAAAAAAARDTRLLNDVLDLANQNTLTLARLQTLLSAAVVADAKHAALLADTATLKSGVGAVDGRLQSVQTELGGTDGRVRDVRTAVTGVSAQASDINLGIFGLRDHMSDLSTGIHASLAGVSTAVAGVSGQATEINLGIFGLRDHMSDLSTGIHTNVTGVGAAVAGVRQRAEDVDQRVSTVFDRVGVVGSAVDGVGAGVTSALDALGEVGGQAGVIDGRTIGLASAVADLDGDMAVIGAGVLQTDDRVAAVQTLAETLLADLTAGRADLAALGPRHDAIDARFAAVDQAIAAVSALLAGAIADGFAEAATRADGLRAVADSTASTLDALTDREIETSLSRCDPVISLMLPANQGGQIEAVEALYVLVIDRAERAGFTSSSVAKAREKLAKGRTEMQPGTYRNAFKSFCEGYDELS